MFWEQEVSRVIHYIRNTHPGPCEDNGYGFLLAELQSQNFKIDYNTKVILVWSYELFAQCFNYITQILKWLQKAHIIKF